MYLPTYLLFFLYGYFFFNLYVFHLSTTSVDKIEDLTCRFACNMRQVRGFAGLSHYLTFRVFFSLFLSTLPSSITISSKLSRCLLSILPHTMYTYTIFPSHMGVTFLCCSSVSINLIDSDMQAYIICKLRSRQNTKF